MSRVVVAEVAAELFEKTPMTIAAQESIAPYAFLAESRLPTPLSYQIYPP
jgi:hypothetical protein